jgi:ABC-type glycerol-3-phosphate transport system permease component
MNRGKGSLRRKPIGAATVLAVLLVLTLLPVVWMAISAVKTDREINSIPPTFLPQSFTLDNFVQLFEQFNFGLLTVNSVIVSAFVVALSLVLGGSAAYGFSRYPFRGSTLLLNAILVTRMITPASLVLPLFLMMDQLHLTNSLVGITIGITTLNLPFAVWLLKPFFDALPKEVEEAAVLDGLGPIGVWWRIAIPLAGPGFKTVALFSFIAAWTDLMIPMTMSTRPEGWTLPAGVMQMQTGFKIYWGALMSGGLYLTLPTFLIAAFAQKYLARGVRASL